MFANIYVGRLKCGLRDKDTVFWTWIFPILLATLFYFSFARLDTAITFSPVPAAVVTDSAYQEAETFRQVLEEVSREGESQMLSLTCVNTVEEADQLLDSGKIDGYILVEAAPKLVVKNDGLNQTILKSFLDQYQQTVSSMGHILEQNPQALAQGLAEQIQNRGPYTEEISLTQAQPSSTVNYYYVLLAMVCLYGAFQGLVSITYLQANLSSLGARRSLAPVCKLKVVVYDLLGGFTIHSICLIIVLAYIALVLGVNFGPKTGFVLLTCIVGSLVGVSLGTLVTAATRWKESVKSAILISVTMVCCFLAGLMVTGINYAVEKSAPIVSLLNPAARIADAFYCLYYYDTYQKYFWNIGILLIMSAAMMGLAALFLRRQKYESL